MSEVIVQLCKRTNVTESRFYRNSVSSVWRTVCNADVFFFSTDYQYITRKIFARNTVRGDRIFFDETLESLYRGTGSQPRYEVSRYEAPSSSAVRGKLPDRSERADEPETSEIEFSEN